MKKYILPYFLLCSFSLFCVAAFAQSTGINTTAPNTNAALDVQNASTRNQGLLIPRMPATTKSTFGLGTGDKGMIFYGSDTDSIYYWTGTKWVTLQLVSTSASEPWTRTGTNVQLTTASDYVGIGVLPSGTKFEVRGIDATPTNLAFRITNSATTTLMTVSNAGDIAFPQIVGPGVATISAAGKLGVVSGSPVTGSGVANKVAFWNGTGSLSSNTNFHWDNTNGRLGIGTTSPSYTLDVTGSSATYVASFSNTSASGTAGVYGNGVRGVWGNGTSYGVVGYSPTGSAGVYGQVGGTSGWGGTFTNATTTANLGGTYAGVFTGGGVGIGVNPTVNLSVAGAGTGVAHIGNVFSTANYVGINLNGTITDGNYNILSSPSDPNLYINRGTGYSINFRENNTDQVIIAPAGDNTTAKGHLQITSANTWGTALQLTNTSSSSTYYIVSSGSAHPLGAGNFVIQDLIGPNYFFAFNSLRGSTYISPPSSSSQTLYTGIGYAPTYNLGTTYLLSVNGNVLAASYTNSSDERFKTNILPIGSALSKLRNVAGVYYFWRKDAFPDRNFSEERQVGVIAQAVEKYFPEIVVTGSDGYKAVDYPKLTPILLQAIKELDEIVLKQDERIRKLEEEEEQERKELQELRQQLSGILQQLKLNSEIKAAVK